LGGRRIAVKAKVMVSTKATDPKVSSEKGARRVKVVIGIHY
jgi:hypothetical protein